MKKRTIIIVAAIALTALLFYFSKSGFLHKGGMSPVRASTASAQEKPGSMPGMPGMAAENQPRKHRPPRRPKPKLRRSRSRRKNSS